MSLPAATRNRAVLFGGGLLAAGFTVGFLTGRESMRHEPAVPPAISAAHGATDGPDHDHDHAGERDGPHTFTGNINVPPHGPEGHGAASALLADAMCPCGGCRGMKLLECGCDRAKEIEGLAAHLLERGKPEAEVLATLVADYGLAATAAEPSRSGLQRLSESLPLGPGIPGPAEVPSGARKTGAPGG